MCVFDCFCVFVLSPKKWKEMNIIYSSVFFEKHPGVCFLSGQEFPSSWCYFDGIKKPLKGWCRRSWQPWLNGKIGWCHLVHLRQNKQFWIPKLQGVGCFISWRSSLRNDIVVHLELLHFSSSVHLHICVWKHLREQHFLDQLPISTLAWMINWTYGFVWKSWGKMELQIPNHGGMPHLTVARAPVLRWRRSFGRSRWRPLRHVAPLAEDTWRNPAAGSAHMVSMVPWYVLAVLFLLMLNIMEHLQSVSIGISPNLRFCSRVSWAAFQTPLSHWITSWWLA